MEQKDNIPGTGQDSLLVNWAATSAPSVIKVIGVGGGGGNAVAQMYHEGIPGVKLMVCNTDSKALSDSPLTDRLQLGPGLGAGGNPEIGREYAEESIDAIRASFDDGVKMVFLTAGMGGGTGTGATPVLAREARTRGILTVGIVTLPFLFEREKQIDKALDGLDALAAEVDALLVINNERLMEIYPTQDILAAFKKVDETLTTAVRSIVDIINMHGRVNLDFRDVSTVLKDGGVAVISTGYGEGPDRVRRAIEDALYSPLLNNNDVYRSKRIVIKVTVGEKEGPCALQMAEFSEINDFTARFGDDLATKWGLDFDSRLEGKVKVTILASGYSLYGAPAAPAPAHLPDPEAEKREERRSAFYTRGTKPHTREVRAARLHFYLYGLDDLDNEMLVELVDAVPTRSRTAADLQRIANQSAPKEQQPDAEEAERPDVIYFSDTTTSK